MSMTNEEAQLIAERLGRAIDLLRAELGALRSEVAHNSSFSSHRLDSLEKIAADHETRLRSATDGVTQFKVFSGLASGGSGLMSLIALLKAYLGG